MIYLDNNATTRVLDSVVKAMLPYFTENFANPASAYGQFSGSAQHVAGARAELASLLDADSGDQMVVTSGATEANNLALLGSARAAPDRRHIVISAIEHPSVMETARFLASIGYDLTILPVSRSGVVLIEDLRSQLREDTLFVSIMLANNETGAVQPIAEASALVKEFDPEILFHTDATQAVGKIPVFLNTDLTSVDLLSLSAHKFHGPKGVGSLFVRNSDSISRIIHGGGQQDGLRSGTENPALLIGMVTALRNADENFARYAEIEELRDRIQTEFAALWPRSYTLSFNSPRLPNTLNQCMLGVDGDELVDRLAARGIAIATGSACSHGATKPSYVVEAMGVRHNEAKCCIRISLSLESSDRDIDVLIDTVAAILLELPQELSSTDLRDRPR
jgi:cysteine desulfurase